MSAQDSTFWTPSIPLCRLCGERLREHGTRHHEHCLDVFDYAIGTLASNLAVAGALCRAFELGELFGGQWMARDPIYPTWEPGARSTAPDGERLRALQQAVKDKLTACGWPSPAPHPTTTSGEGE